MEIVLERPAFKINPMIFLIIIGLLILFAVSNGLTHAVVTHGDDFTNAQNCHQNGGTYATFIEPAHYVGATFAPDTMHNLCKAPSGLIYDVLCRWNNGAWKIFNGFMPKDGSEQAILNWLRRKPGIYQTQTNYGDCQ
jgi:hypothetical protein